MHTAARHARTVSAQTPVKANRTPAFGKRTCHIEQNCSFLLKSAINGVGLIADSTADDLCRCAVHSLSAQNNKRT